MAAGSISLEEFNDLAMKFANISTKSNDSWILKTSPRDGSEMYLEKIALIGDKPTSENETSCCSREKRCILLEEDSTVEDPDPSCLQSAIPSHDCFLRLQFHVVYSHSYSVPVLYFSACKKDGKRLSLEELWSRVPVEYEHRMHDNKWATLTQQEHPFLGSPFFMLHPCHTTSLMSQVPNAEDKRYYLVKWLSTVGPVVGLKLSPAYATAFDVSDET